MKSSIVIKGVNAINQKTQTPNERDSAQRGVNSVQPSSTQSSGLCRLGTIESRIELRTVAMCEKDMCLPIQLRYLIWVMLHSGCRVNEVLRLRVTDVNYMNDICLQESKGGIKRIVRIPDLLGLKLLQVCHMTMLFNDYNRFYIYRLLKKRGIYYPSEEGIHSPVTHVFRHIYANRILEITEKSQTTARALGHKRTDTIDYYAKDT